MFLVRSSRIALIREHRKGRVWRELFAQVSEDYQLWQYIKYHFNLRYMCKSSASMRNVDLHACENGRDSLTNSNLSLKRRCCSPLVLVRLLFRLCCC